MDATPGGLIEVDGLTYRYPSQDGDPLAAALDNVSFRVEPGQLLGVLGTSGSGKTTLCLTLNGIVPQRTGGVMAGSVRIGGWDTRRRPVAELATKVACVFQEPDANLVGLSVEDEVAFGPENLGVPGQEIGRRVDWGLARVGMERHREASPARLSGGQKQRVAIAAALAMRPAILVLDEPMAALDPVGAAQVLALVDRLRAPADTTIVLVSRDADVLAEHADHVLALDAGRVVAAGSPRDIFAGQRLAEFARRGLPTPQLAQVAAGINERLGTAFAFLTEEQARITLSQALQERRRSKTTSPANADRG